MRGLAASSTGPARKNLIRLGTTMPAYLQLPLCAIRRSARSRVFQGAIHPVLPNGGSPRSRAMCVRGQSDDAREGVTSFLEKRALEFTDRVSDGLPELCPTEEVPAYS